MTTNYKLELVLFSHVISTGTYWTLEEATRAGKNGLHLRGVRGTTWRVRNMTTGDIIEQGASEYSPTRYAIA